MTYPHVPVLLDMCVELLGHGIEEARARGIAPVVIDFTLGMGGHSEGILRAFDDVHVIGIDRDPAAIEIATSRLAPFGSRFEAVCTSDDNIAQVLEQRGNPPISGVLFDLGVSSLQLDDDARGFSYSRDTPLDMRMNPTEGISAADVLATYSENDLTRIISTYGEERYARKIARAIVADREHTQWTTTQQLADLIGRIVPDPKNQRKRSHPAKRTFQALRIEVNDELGNITRALPAALSALHLGGVAVVESYQSGEDTIVKRIFRQGTTVQAPPDLPVVPDHLKPWLEEIVRGAYKAPQEEIDHNPRAASVRLRAVRKIGVDPA
ncbi:16S rRNA (cytosine(1402)-N(4))-methyltransferase RsmH [Brevibacterium sp. UMB1308A]|uniref:16S rRNA (cytosine(1402)-N(4))-methyltransferase RsmH n=1 Tax=Brevibacterium sp. UMB1308A TaxID=3050608 RepID=UPI00254B1DE2|nr:16S rRNA (cytosine(1402)-N(4))-methyltransferase RsmH [Brevibacterium sp. UMB1308A]MDK8346447.1 16S rRNA (cytosine(1402)-N(4))-methyltransferase RsmH [Brevibacterium sp. UMB1308B]MDK8713302.1 16S rRNA (cytosine(1402)-N(4))-methyltransferase RsmH [Brevibacterium sp. UMB1308A]